MNTFFKKLFCIALAACMLLALCACAGNKPIDANASESPDVTENTAEATEAPTEAPTPEPTEAPTPEPTAVPEPVELAFDDCAEAILNLVPGEKEDEVNYFEEDWAVIGPQHFYVSADTVYILDRHDSYLTYNMQTGVIERIRFSYIGDSRTEFAVLDGKIYTGGRIFDIASGAQEDIMPIVPVAEMEVAIERMEVRGGQCFAYVDTTDRTESYPDAITIVEFVYSPEAKAWRGVREAWRYEWTYTESGARHKGDMVIAESGLRFPSNGSFLGSDAEGNMFMLMYEEQSDGSVRTFLRKYGPEGNLLAFTDISGRFEHNVCGVGDTRLGEDGCVYVMYGTETEFKVYKIAL